MANWIDIPLVQHPVVGQVRPPGSKSLTNRALVCSALASGTSTLHGLLRSEDSGVMIDAWNLVGVHVEPNWNQMTAKVAGIGSASAPLRLPIDRLDQPIDIRNSGTSIRFLTAALAAVGGEFVLDGIPRMRQRPIGDLVKSLQSLGCRVVCEDAQFPPVKIQGGSMKGGAATVAGDISSQFLSGLLMAAPLAKEKVTLQIEGNLVSRPYVEMTLKVMKEFGVEVDQPNENQFCISPSVYQACDYQVEPDASAASYFWAVAAIIGGKVTVQGLSENSLQGDVGFVRCLEKMGCGVEVTSDSITVQGGQLQGIEIDMADISDTVQTLSAVALFADGPTTVRGVEHNRHKETDRIEDLARELRKLGAKVDTFQDGMTIVPGELQAAEIETYNDHRMAMSLALVGLKQPGIRILDPGCTAKTYPEYFEDLFKLVKVGG